MSDDRKDIPNASAPNWQQRVTEAMRVYMGKTGNVLDRGVTMRDLVDAGIAELRGTAGRYLGLKPGTGVLGGGSVGGGGGGGGGADPYEPDLTPPPQPTGFGAVAAISNVLVEHDAPTYTVGHGHARTVLYGAKRASGAAAPVFSDAVQLAEFSGTVYAYPTDPSTTWHLWIKWRSVDGVLSTTPAGNTNGVVAITGQDVGALLDALTGQITESELYSGLGSRIDLIDAAASVPGSVNSRIATVTASITDGPGAPFAPFQSWEFQGTLDGWEVAGATLTSGVSTAILASTGADPILLRQSLSINGALYPKIRARIRRLAGTTWQGDLFYVTPGHGETGLYYKRIPDPGPGWQIIEWDMAALTAGGTDWTTSTIQRIRLDLGTSALDIFEIDWIAVGARSSGVSVATVQTEATARATADGALFAQYTVKVDVAGLVSGYGLASSANNAAPTSAFGVRANQFYVAPPSVAQATAPTADLYDGYVWLDTSVTPNVTRYRSGAAWVTTAPRLPFVIQTTPTTINGVAVPPGVYMSDGYIINGTITNLKVANGAIDDLKVANVSASKLTAGSIAVGQYIQSTSFVSGSSGWRINGDGTAEFSGVIVRGTVYASDGLIGGIVIDALGIRSTNYNAAGTGFRIRNNGTIDLPDGSINVGVGSNLLVNSELVSTRGWNLYDGSAGQMDAANTTINKPNDGYRLRGGNTLATHQIGENQGPIGWYIDVPIEMGKRYEFSVYAASHRCVAYMSIEWLDGNNAGFSSTNTGGTVPNVGGGFVLDHYTRISAFGVAPSGSYAARILLWKQPTTPSVGAADSWAWFTHPYFGAAGAAQLVPSAYSPGGVGTFIGPEGITTPSLSALSANLGYVNAGAMDIYSDGTGSTGYIRSAGKSIYDGQSGWILAREPSGQNYFELRAGAGVIQFHSNGNYRIAMPGINMDQNGLTVSQVDVIDTLNVRGNAITVPAAAFTAGSISAGASQTVAQQASMDLGSVSAPVLVRVSALLNFNNSGGYAVYRDGTLLANENFTSTSIQLAIDFIDYPGSGAHTYQLLISSNNGSVVASRRTISLLACKR